MDELLNSNNPSRLARTLGVEFGEAVPEKSAFNGGAINPAGKAVANSASSDADIWKQKARKELEAEISLKYEKLYAEKLKKVEQNEVLYRESSARLAELMTSVKRAGEETLDFGLKDLNAITASLVLQSLYKILGDDKKYKTFAVKVVQDSISSFAEEVNIRGLISQYDYDLLAKDPLFAELKTFIRPDEKLKKGQFSIDDGSTTYEMGILDRLDVLRSAFMNAVGQVR